MDYASYLRLPQLLSNQQMESAKRGAPAHDEMLFIVIHQTYELWFKQILFELDLIQAIFGGKTVDDADLGRAVHAAERIVKIEQLLVGQIDILETMTPMDFLDFRDMLRPASGFQSWQFKQLEAKLGLKYEQRHGQEYYTSQLTKEYVDIIKKSEAEMSLLEHVNAWLERMPFHDADENFWSHYKKQYELSLAKEEKDNLAGFDEVFLNDRSSLTPHRSLSPSACRAALFILLYRGYPMLHLPFQLLNALLEIDVQLSSWRYRHMNMVHRMIGTRIGTGGSSGKDYLRAAADRHYIFKEFAQLNSFLVERKRLPVLSHQLQIMLGFVFR